LEKTSLSPDGAAAGRAHTHSTASLGSRPAPGPVDCSGCGNADLHPRDAHWGGTWGVRRGGTRGDRRCGWWGGKRGGKRGGAREEPMRQRMMRRAMESMRQRMMRRAGEPMRQQMERRAGEPMRQPSTRRHRYSFGRGRGQTRSRMGRIPRQIPNRWCRHAGP
jgi:hypothetical protein